MARGSGDGGAGGLPVGWEWDYDGSRWFYKYKPNGHIQYHFPSEGDEFPEFVDSAELAPALAPEERLESQQQVRRVTGVVAPSGRKRQGNNGKRAMTATARPVGIEWDGDAGADDDDDDGVDAAEGAAAPGEGRVFQPENFMFLGPSTYVDVSPLNEDEEEAAKRSVVGITETAGAEGSGRVFISPPESASAGTPAGKNSELATPAAECPSDAAESVQQQQVTTIPEGNNKATTIRTFEIDHSAIATTAAMTVQQEEPAAIPPPMQEAARHEQPVPEHAPPFNPIGVIAEMATEDTPRSYIEMNPIPVEIGDSSVLAPIETVAPLGIAELPGQMSPTEAKAPSAAAAAAAAAAMATKTTEEESPLEVTKGEINAQTGKEEPNLSVAQIPRPDGAVFVPPKPVAASTMPLQLRAPMRMKIKRKPTEPSISSPSSVSASSLAASPSPVSAHAPRPLAASTPQYKPYVPASSLRHADTAPVRVPVAKPTLPKQQPQDQKTTPTVSPQLNHVPSVLRPANRKSWQPGGGVAMPQQRAPSTASSVVNHPVALNTARYSLNILPGQVPANVAVLGSGPPPEQAGPLPIQPQHKPPQMMPGQGIGPHTQQPQQPQQHMVQQAPMRPPLQHGQPTGIRPGQYPPLPIPQPYSQHQQHPHPIGRPAPPPWFSPSQQGPGQEYMMPHQQQQQPPLLHQHQHYPLPGWTGQPGPPQQQPPAQQKTHSRPDISPQQLPMAPMYQTTSAAPARAQLPPRSQSVVGLMQHNSQTQQTAFSEVSFNQKPQFQAPRRSSTLDSAGVSPLRPRAESESSSITLASPSPMEQSRRASAGRSSVSSAHSQNSGQQEEKSIPLNWKVGTGLDSRDAASRKTTSTNDSYFPPSKEHAIGLEEKMAEQFSSESSKATSGSAGQTLNTTGSTGDGRPLGTPSTGPGRILGRIEEHEAEIASVFVNSVHGSRGSSIAAASQQSPPSRPLTIHSQLAPAPAAQPGPSNNMGRPPQVPPRPINTPSGVMAPQGPPHMMGVPLGLMPPPPPSGQTLSSDTIGSPKHVPSQVFTPTQQQWQSSMQQPMQGTQLPGTVPPPMQMQPSKSKDNKWTKWFKISKSTKKPENPQIAQTQHRQPRPQSWGQQWQPGAPMQGPPQMGGPLPPPNLPANGYHLHQAPPSGPSKGPMSVVMQKGFPGPNMQQQFTSGPNQPEQPAQMGQPFGAPMQQQFQPGAPMMHMHPQAVCGSPAPPQMTTMYQDSKSPSLTSVAASPYTGPVQSVAQGHASSQMGNNMMPPPLSVRRKSMVPSGNPTAPLVQSNAQVS